MAKEFTVIWAAKILANNEEDAALAARRTIADAPYSYFDVYEKETPYSVEVLNDGQYMDAPSARPHYPLAPRTNN